MSWTDLEPMSKDAWETLQAWLEKEHTRDVECMYSDMHHEIYQGLRTGELAKWPMWYLCE